jgi:hypothetical protein
MGDNVTQMSSKNNTNRKLGSSIILALAFYDPAGAGLGEGEFEG